MNIKISQNKFCEIIAALKRQCDLDFERSYAIQKLGNGHIVATTPLVNHTVKFLDDILCPESRLVEYFAWEREWGRRGSIDCITNLDGTKFSLRNAKELYKYITQYGE